MSLNGAVLALQAKMSAISGVRLVPDYPTDTAAVFPAIVSYCVGLNGSELRGGALGEGGEMRDLWVIATEIHVPNKDTAQGIEALQQLWEPFLAAVWSDTLLGGNVDTIEAVTGELDGEGNWGGTGTLVLRFRTNVKIRRIA